MKSIAFCFLIYDKINHESIWHTFFENVDPRKYTIYIHFKNNRPLQYFEKYKLNQCVETHYADISLVHAQNRLLESAIEVPENMHFIFLSNTFIPVKSFDFIYSCLDNNFSYFNISPIQQSFPRCNQTTEYIDQKYIQKAGQWCILNRKHTILMLNNNDYIQWFNYRETVPDEHCYITKLYHEHLENEIIVTRHRTVDATTFTNWSDMEYKYPSNVGLKTYDTITNEELMYIVNSKSFFARKFSECCRNLYSNKIYMNKIQEHNYS